MGNEPPKVEKPVKEQIREQKRSIDKSMRGIEREMAKLQREEKKVLAEMKKMGQKGQDQAARSLAKDIVRTRGQIKQMNAFCGNLKAVSLRLSSVSTLNEMSDAMENATKAMCLVSNKLDATKLANLGRQMAMEDGKLDMKQEMISSVLDDMGENMDNPLEEEKIYQDLLKEVGIEVKNSMPEISNKNNLKKVEVKEVEKDSLEDMLNSLNNK